MWQTNKIQLFFLKPANSGEKRTDGKKARSSDSSDGSVVRTRVASMPLSGPMGYPFFQGYYERTDWVLEPTPAHCRRVVVFHDDSTDPVRIVAINPEHLWLLANGSTDRLSCTACRSAERHDAWITQESFDDASAWTTATVYV